MAAVAPPAATEANPGTVLLQPAGAGYQWRATVWTPAGQVTVVRPTLHEAYEAALEAQAGAARGVRSVSRDGPPRGQARAS